MHPTVVYALSLLSNQTLPNNVSEELGDQPSVTILDSHESQWVSYHLIYFACTVIATTLSDIVLNKLNTLIRQWRPPSQGDDILQPLHQDVGDCSENNNSLLEKPSTVAQAASVNREINLAITAAEADASLQESEPPQQPPRHPSKWKVKTGSQQKQPLRTSSAPYLNTRKEIAITDRKEMPLVPLSGKHIANLNLWGIVEGGGVERQPFYQRSLQAGNISGHAAIKHLGNDTYEIRTKFDYRLLGKLVRGEQQITKELSQFYPEKTAQELTTQMKGKHPEELAIIVFNDEKRHQHIHRAI